MTVEDVVVTFWWWAGPDVCHGVTKPFYITKHNGPHHRKKEDVCTQARTSAWTARNLTHKARIRCRVFHPLRSTSCTSSQSMYTQSLQLRHVVIPKTSSCSLFAFSDMKKKFALQLNILTLTQDIPEESRGRPRFSILAAGKNAPNRGTQCRLSWKHEITAFNHYFERLMFSTRQLLTEHSALCSCFRILEHVARRSRPLRRLWSRMRTQLWFGTKTDPESLEDHIWTCHSFIII